MELDVVGVPILVSQSDHCLECEYQLRIDAYLSRCMRVTVSWQDSGHRMRTTTE